MQASSQYRFGRFRLIPEENLLFNDEPVGLPPKCLQLLTVFVKHWRRTLRKEFLIDQLWPDPDTGSEDSFGFHLSKLRTVLRSCDPSRPYIRTVPRTGYKFAVKVFTANTGGTAESEYPPFPYQLSAPFQDFVGRKKQLKTLADRLSSMHGAKIAVIDGMAGIGKTQLALMLADQLSEYYPDAQLFVELNGTDASPVEPAEAMKRCIRAVQPDIRLPEDQTDLTNLYRSSLSDLQALILFDNAADAQQVMPLLPPRDCGAIITSRQKLSIPGSARVLLEQLTPDEAQELLRSIAPHVSSEVATEICGLCENLPLAVRAVGSLLSVTADLEPPQFAKNLREERLRLQLLKSGPDTDVEASLSLSYLALDQNAARVFRQLAVFTSTFDATAEEKICADTGRVGLSELLRRSMVMFDADTRRYRLHDLVRLLAQNRSTLEEAHESGLNHSEYYRTTLADANELLKRGGSSIQRGLMLFDVEWQNIKDGYVWARNHTTTDPAAAELSNSYPTVGRDILSIRLDSREQINWWTWAIAAARLLDYRADEGQHYGYLGEAYRKLGDSQRALQYHQESLRIAQELGDKQNEGVAYGGLGNVYDNMGEFRLALSCYDKARELAHQAGDKGREGGAFGNLGVEHWRLGELELALKCHYKHLALAQQVGDRLGEAFALGNLGLVYATQGESKRAIDLNKQALVIFRQIGDLRSEADALGNIGKGHAALGEFREAVRYYKRERRIAVQIANPELEAESLNYLGESYSCLDHKNRAVKLYGKAVAIAASIGNRRIEGEVLDNMSTVLNDLGRIGNALECGQKALEIYRQIEHPKSSELSVRLSSWRQQHESDQLG